jgi:hypothetical protein
MAGFFLLASLVLAITVRAEIIEWKLDTDMIMHVQGMKRCILI